MGRLLTLQEVNDIVATIYHLVLYNRNGTDLTALAGADAVVVSRALVVTHHAGFVDTGRGRGAAGGAEVAGPRAPVTGAVHVVPVSRRGREHVARCKRINEDHNELLTLRHGLFKLRHEFLLIYIELFSLRHGLFSFRHVFSHWNTVYSHISFRLVELTRPDQSKLNFNPKLHSCALFCFAFLLRLFSKDVAFAQITGMDVKPIRCQSIIWSSSRQFK